MAHKDSSPEAKGPPPSLVCSPRGPVPIPGAQGPSFQQAVSDATGGFAQVVR